MKEKKVKIKFSHYIEFLLARGLIFVFLLIPFSLRSFLFSRMALAIYYLSWHYRRLVYKNLHTVFRKNKTKKEKLALTKQHFFFLGKFLSEFVQVTFLNPKKMMKQISFENKELAEEVFSQGTVLIGPHVGNWEWLIVTLGIYSSQGSIAVVKQQSNPLSNRYIKNIRIKYNTNILFTRKPYKSHESFAKEKNRTFVGRSKCGRLRRVFSFL